MPADIPEPVAEAAAILTRCFEALARASGKTLSQRMRVDLVRACELLSNPRPELDDLLDDLLTMPAQPRPRVTAVIDRETDPNYEAWRQSRREREQ